MLESHKTHLVGEIEACLLGRLIIRPAASHGLLRV